MNVKVSVLMSVYEKEKPQYLEESLDSIRCQTFRDFELVLVEDGPLGTDLEQVVQRYLRIMPDRVKLVKILKNLGLASALNRGLEYCHGIYIARMDSDDIMSSNRLKIQYQYLEAHPEIDVIGSNIIEINENGKFLKMVRYPSSHLRCRRMFIFRDCFAHPAVMFRRDFFEDVGNYSEKHKNQNKNEDTNLWFRGFVAGKTYANIQEVLLYYRRTNDFYARRVGIKRGIDMARDRLVINREMGYGIIGYIFILLRLVLNIMPKAVLKQLYKFR